MGNKSCKRPWRKIVKKMQRKRRRQKLARQRDNEMKETELEKLKDPLYKSWVEKQEEIKSQQQVEQEKERQAQEELWLRRELLAQKQFKRDELKRRAEEAELEAARLKREEEFKLLEADCKKKREEINLQAEKAAKDFDNIMMIMQEYLEDFKMKTPKRLELSVESRPGGTSCAFFDKTNCCRFGYGCSFNHKRPMLTKIIFIKHFFQHPLLEQQEHFEYLMSDSELELSEHDLRDAYDEFCEDVWPVLEEFGSIVNFRAVRNTHAHLRGHVFVEYAEKRSALKAFINLQNRYYASKRLNVEFSNIKHWHKGVCGLSLDRKCTKDYKCNFLHLMKNKNNKYNQPIINPERSHRSTIESTKAVRESSVISWNSEDIARSKRSGTRNWRWSESPELELNTGSSGGTSKLEIDSSKLSNSAQRKSSISRYRSYSPSSTRDNKSRRSRPLSRNSDCNRTSKSPPSSHRKRASKSSSHCRSTNVSPVLSRQEKSTSSSKPERTNVESPKSKSKRRKKSRRKSKSPDFNKYHKKHKTSRSKSPSGRKSNKKLEKTSLVK